MLKRKCQHSLRCAIYNIPVALALSLGDHTVKGLFADIWSCCISCISYLWILHMKFVDGRKKSTKKHKITVTALSWEFEKS